MPKAFGLSCFTVALAITLRSGIDSRASELDVGSLSRLLSDYVLYDEFSQQCRTERPELYAKGKATLDQTASVRGDVEKIILSGVDPGYQNGIMAWTKAMVPGNRKSVLESMGNDIDALCEQLPAYLEGEFLKVRNGDIQREADAVKARASRLSPEDLLAQKATRKAEEAKARVRNAPPFKTAKELEDAVYAYKEAKDVTADGRVRQLGSLCARIESTEVRDWEGSVARLSGEASGARESATLTVNVGQISLWTVDSRADDPQGDRRVMRGGVVYDAISRLKLEQKVKVSGRFVSACDPRLFGGPVVDLLFRFTAVQAE